jgi:hypothetical protein
MRLIKLYFKIRSKTCVFTFINIMLYLLFCYKVLYLVIHISLEIAEMKLLISEHHLRILATVGHSHLPTKHNTCYLCLYNVVCSSASHLLLIS